MSTQARSDSLFAVCVRNDDNPVSLELRKLYEVVPDTEAERMGMIRVIDESGEDYLYPRDYFLELPLTQKDEQTIRRAS